MCHVGPAVDRLENHLQRHLYVARDVARDVALERDRAEVGVAEAAALRWKYVQGITLCAATGPTGRINLAFGYFVAAPSEESCQFTAGACSTLRLRYDFLILLS